jgi:RNA polymerase sigma factor (sigma-70 family)
MASVSKSIGEFNADPAHGSFHAWLLQLIRWRVLDQIRRRMPLAASSADPRTSGTGTSTIARIPDPKEVDLEAMCDAEWRQTLLAQAMNELQVEVSATQYQVFHLVSVQGMPVVQAAQILGKSRPRVYLMRHRATKALKRIVERLEKRTGMKVGGLSEARNSAQGPLSRPLST